MRERSCRISLCLVAGGECVSQLLTHCFVQRAAQVFTITRDTDQAGGDQLLDVMRDGWRANVELVDQLLQRTAVQHGCALAFGMAQQAQINGKTMRIAQRTKRLRQLAGFA